MGSFSLPWTVNPASLISQASYFHHGRNLLGTQQEAACVQSPALTHRPLVQRNSSSSSSRQRGVSSSLVAFDAKGSGSPGDELEHRALEAVLKLYSAIKNQNVSELSAIICDECRCVCNFISYFQPLQGKKQVLDFFNYLIKYFGDSIEFVVKPTLNDGLNVGVSWKLEWNKNHVPLGKGFSFHVCQIYQGKILIRNMEMFIEPIFHLEPFRLKIMGVAMNIMDKMSSPYRMLTNERRKAASCLLLALISVAAILFFLKPGFY